MGFRWDGMEGMNCRNESGEKEGIVSLDGSIEKLSGDECRQYTFEHESAESYVVATRKGGGVSPIPTPILATASPRSNVQ